MASVVAGVLMVMTEALSLRPTLFVTGLVTLIAAALLGRAMHGAGIELVTSSEASEQPA